MTYVVDCDLDQIQSQGQGHGTFELPTIAHNCTFPHLSPLPLLRGAQNWCLSEIDWTWTTACRSPIFDVPSRKAITTVQTSPNVDISRHSNGHISVVRDATVRWLGVLVVVQVLCMLIWPWPAPSKVKVTGHLNFRKLAKPCMRAGGDDRQPPSGAFRFNIILTTLSICCYRIRSYFVKEFNSDKEFSQIKQNKCFSEWLMQYACGRIAEPPDQTYIRISAEWPDS